MTVHDEQTRLAVEGFREDLAQQRRRDAKKIAANNEKVIRLRCKALLVAIEQDGPGEEWTPYPVRQAAIDLAAACAALAVRLPRPTVPAERDQRKLAA